jgi:predicted CxxxxCH...CXXCH cytochrome family protein
MRSSTLSILVALASLGLAACDPRPAEGGGTPLPISGAHTIHLYGSSLAEPIVSCRECHNSQFEVTLEGPLASAKGAEGVFDTKALTCSNVYCHSGGPDLQIGGGTVQPPVWNPPSSIVCGGCHASPGAGTPTPWHPAVAPQVQCAICHPGYTNTEVNRPIHVNGEVNLTVDDLGTSCVACHGDADRALPDGASPVLLAAPPVDRSGSDETTQVGVGAHQQHLLPGAAAISNPILCTECHTVPLDLEHVGPEPSTPAKLVWGRIATSGDVAPTFDRASATCTNYCHGATLLGGVTTQPIWTQVDGTQARCGACHGDPPPSGQHELHTSSVWAVPVSCGVCHRTGYAPGVVGAPVIPIHVNGQLDMNPVGFSNWDPSAAPVGPGTLRGTATGCHGGTRYWTGFSPLGGCS